MLADADAGQQAVVRGKPSVLVGTDVDDDEVGQPAGHADTEVGMVAHHRLMGSGSGVAAFEAMTPAAGRATGAAVVRVAGPVAGVALGCGPLAVRGEGGRVGPAGHTTGQ